MLKLACKQYGGKYYITKWIISNFPKHHIYVEPFCGSCSVLFAKEPSPIEVINDLDDKIINVFEQIRQRPQELAALLWATPYAKANWRSAITKDALEEARLTIAKSVQFYCGGKTSTWTIDKSPNQHRPKSEVWADWFLRILPAAARLKDVQILQEDAITTIQRFYQIPEAFIYVDPPYLGHEKEYSFNVNYVEMVNLLRQAKCTVMVSEYERADPYYVGWRKLTKETVGRCRTGSHNMKAKKNLESLYLNYDEKDNLLQF